MGYNMTMQWVDLMAQPLDWDTVKLDELIATFFIQGLIQSVRADWEGSTITQQMTGPSRIARADEALQIIAKSIRPLVEARPRSDRVSTSQCIDSYNHANIILEKRTLCC